jgi:hypothetical protein
MKMIVGSGSRLPTRSTKPRKPFLAGRANRFRTHDRASCISRIFVGIELEPALPESNASSIRTGLGSEVHFEAGPDHGAELVETAPDGSMT